MMNDIQRQDPIRLAFLAGSCLWAIVATSTEVVAQTTKGLEEVIVTAQRRTERFEDVPASISVVSGQALAQAGIVRFTDFGQTVPGLQIGATAGYIQPAIRGISTTFTGDQNNVAIYVDGFYQVSPLSINQDLANIESVEVLKGPQGSLYGRNATGGAILIRTTEPGDVATGKISVSYGKLNDLSLRGVVSAPLVQDKLAFSIAAAYRKNDGYIKDINCFASPATRASKSTQRRTGTDGCNTAPFSSTAVRAKLTFTPSEALSFTLGYNFAHVSDARGYAYQLYDHIGTTQGLVLAGRFPAAAGYQQAYQMRDRTSLNFQPYAVDETHELTLLATLQTGDVGKLSSRTSFMREWNVGDIDLDMTPADATALLGVSHRQVFTQAIDYEYTGIKRLDLLVGGFFFNDKTPYNFSQVTALILATPANPNGVLQTTSSYINTPYSYSGYIDGTYHVTDQLFLTAGFRYTNEKRRADYLIRNAAGVFVSQRAVSQSGSATFHATTPRVNVRYNFSDGANVYASYSQGFKSGTYNTAPAFVVPVQPETVDAYEIGAKIARGDFRVDAAAFYYDYKNLQISKTVFNPATNANQSAISNATSSEIYGAELNVAAKVTSELTMTAGIAYLHARYKDFRTATGTDTRIDNQTEVNSTPANPQDWSGLPAIRSPKFSGTFTATYTTELARGMMELSGNLYATTSYVPKDNSVIRFVTSTGATVQDTHQRRFVQPGYAILNFHAKWTDPSDHYSVGAYLRNATNTRHRVLFTSTTAGDFATYSEPRTFGAELSYKF